MTDGRKKRMGRPSKEISKDDLRYTILAVDLNMITVKEACEELGGISRSTYYRLRGSEGYEKLPL